MELVICKQLKSEFWVYLGQNEVDFEMLSKKCLMNIFWAKINILCKLGQNKLCGLDAYVKTCLESMFYLKTL